MMRLLFLAGPVILSAAKNPFARLHAGMLLDSSPSLRMTNKGQWSEKPSGASALNLFSA